jgi:hypothetical protein
MVQIGFGTHPALYPVGFRDSFPVNKAVGAWSWSLTFNYNRYHESFDLYIHSPQAFMAYCSVTYALEETSTL